MDGKVERPLLRNRHKVLLEVQGQDRKTERKSADNQGLSMNNKQ